MTGMPATEPANSAALDGSPAQGAIPYTVAPDVSPLWDKAVEHCIAAFMEWLGRESRERRLPITEARVYRWQSIEDPRDQNLIIEVRVQGQTAAVQEFWTAAAFALEDLIRLNVTPVTDTLTVQFHWL